MSSSTLATNSSSGNAKNSNSSNNASDIINTSPTNTSSSTPLVPPPPSQETQSSNTVPPPNNSNSNSNLNTGSNGKASPSPPGQENIPTPPTPPNNSNSNLNNTPPPQQSSETPKSLSPPLPPQTSNPSSPIVLNARNPSSSPPPPNSNSNIYSKPPTPPTTVYLTPQTPQSKPIQPVNTSPSQITPANASTPLPPNQSNTSINSPVIQLLPKQTPPAGQANAQSGLPGVKPPSPISSSIYSPPFHSSPYSNSTKNSHTNKSNMHIGPVFIVIGAISVLVAVLCLLGRKKKKLNVLVYSQDQQTKSSGVVYQQSYHYGGTPPTDHFCGPPRTSTSSQNFSGNQQGSNNGNYQAGYCPGTPNNHNGSKSCFSYEEILEMTGGFSRENLLGEGGFGCVYKGWLPDGRCVAVKQLKAGSGQGEREFQAEVEIISRIHHRHLVSLVGYCIVEHHRMLVYEFVPNSTLEHHLHGKVVPVMDWGKRMKIAIGSARGLTYLHDDCHPRIIHRDIKSANILLDYAFEAQVADFGLAKFSNDTYTHVSTRVMGTFGYLAPEYASSGKLTDRSDVFSFGVVLLELITGRKPLFADKSLVEWARPILVQALETGNIEELVDPRLENNYTRDEMYLMIEVAAACVRHSAPKRPRMVQVLRALDNDGGHVMDLTNGVKVGQSMAYDPNQSSPSEIQRFRQMAFSIEEEPSEDGEINRPLTRSMEPNILIHQKSRK
ncbi:proline-rich receptor-like protein kinase PERK13 [Carex rostrata]